MNQARKILSHQIKRYAAAIFVAAGILFLPLTKASAQIKKIALKEAIALTLSSHPNATISKNSVMIASQKVKEAKGAFLPSVTINANTDYNLQLQTTIIPAGVFGPEEKKLQMGSPISSNASVQAELPLFDQNAIASLKASHIEKDIADLNTLKENETLIYNTAIAYFEVLSYSEKSKLLGETEKQNQELLKILKLRYEQGVAKKSEYDRARVNLNSTKADLQLSQSRYELALNKLKNAMGIDLGNDVSVSDSVNFTVPQKMVEESVFDPQGLVAWQLDQKNIKAKEIEVSKKRAALMPTFSLYGKYGANSFGDNFSNAYQKLIDYSAVGIKLSIPVFGGFRKSSQLSQSKLTADNQRLTARLNEDNYRLDFQNSATELQSSYNAFVANQENLQLAEEVVTATTIEYREGTADLEAYLDAESSYKEAQTDYSTALLDLLTAKLAFEKANGTLTTYIKNL